jgi:hypothetical protein
VLGGGAIHAEERGWADRFEGPTVYQCKSLVAILDDLLRKVLLKLLASKHRVEPTRGSARELIGVLLKLERPRARLSRSETRGRAFSCLGEFLWYLSGDNQLDFIRHYIKKYEDESEDKKTVYGGYGPRIFRQRGHNQLGNVIALLREHPTFFNRSLSGKQNLLAGPDRTLES